jgi:hypothetical protein
MANLSVILGCYLRHERNCRPCRNLVVYMGFRPSQREIGASTSDAFERLGAGRAPAMKSAPTIQFQINPIARLAFAVASAALHANQINRQRGVNGLGIVRITSRRPCFMAGCACLPMIAPSPSQFGCAVCHWKISRSPVGLPPNRSPPAGNGEPTGD